MKRALILGLFLSVLSPVAHAADQLDAKMAPIVEQYLAISQSLTLDSVDGVQEAAAKIAQMAEGISTKTSSAKDAQYLEGLDKKLAEAASSLAQKTDLATQRKAFKALSQAMALYATVQNPADLEVAYCPMAAAPWLQKEESIQNPYYGPKMAKCGSIIPKE